MAVKTVERNGRVPVESPDELGLVVIDPIRAETIDVPIVGMAPLIVHRFDEKQKRAMLDSMQGRKSSGRWSAMTPHNQGRPGGAGPGAARLGEARLGQARRGRLGWAWPGWAGPGAARHGLAWQAR